MAGKHARRRQNAIANWALDTLANIEWLPTLLFTGAAIIGLPLVWILLNIQYSLFEATSIP